MKIILSISYSLDPTSDISATGDTLCGVILFVYASAAEAGGLRGVGIGSSAHGTVGGGGGGGIPLSSREAKTDRSRLRSRGHEANCIPMCGGPFPIDGTPICTHDEQKDGRAGALFTSLPS